MPKKKKQSAAFIDLTWNDLEEWAGAKIVSRGNSYQQQGRVSDLAVTVDGSLIAWVNGSTRYATKVEVNSEGLPNSICTCPYEFDCKHGVAVVLEYLSRLEKKQRVPNANKSDERILLLADEDWENEDEFGDDILPANFKYEIDAFLTSKTKVQLIDLITTLAGQHPEIAQDIFDLKLLNSGDVKSVVARVRQEIRDIGEEDGWQNYWSGEGFTPDYSAIRNKLETLLEKGHADDVLILGEELIACGIRQIEQSDDHGETQMEIADCMPVILKALTNSSLPLEGRLAWAMDAVLKDDFELCEAFTEYLYRKHTSAAWSALADRLLERLKSFKPHKNGEFGLYERDRLSDWTVHALERSRRNEEINPLCETEAQKTGSYERLVKRLIADRRYEEAEQWIYKGVQAVGKRWPGIAANLRAQLRNIRTRHKDWPAVAALQVYEFIDRPSQPLYSDCKKAAEKAKVWTFVRERLLMFLETGSLPWQSKNWPLPKTGFETPKIQARGPFPEFDTLIDIAISEKLPDRVLHWYDRRPKLRIDWYGSDDDRVAAAIQSHAPERAVGIWQNKAERLIAQVKPSAYKDAAKYLRKAAKVMAVLKKQVDWQRYLHELKQTHAKKRRLMEVLEDLEDKPILKRKQ